MLQRVLHPLFALSASATLQVECLDKFVVVNERHLNLIDREFQWWYNHERPHSARDHLPPGFESPPEEWATVKVDDVVCETRLGGALKHVLATGGVRLFAVLRPLSLRLCSRRARLTCNSHSSICEFYRLWPLTCIGRTTVHSRSRYVIIHWIFPLHTLPEYLYRSVHDRHFERLTADFGHLLRDAICRFV